jgi:RNA polymerase sigma-B factor
VTSRDDQLLFQRYRDSGDALDRERLMHRYLPLARHQASRYAHGREPFDDLYQVACLGLLKAIDRYDVARGTAFASYAIPTIAGEIKRHFRDRTWSVHVPHSAHDLAMRIRTASEGLMAATARQPAVGELAVALDIGEESVKRGLEALAAYEVTSLEQPCGEGDERTLGEALGGHDDAYRLVEQRDALDDLLGCLSVREREVVRLRFHDDLTQQQISDRVGMSQMSVSRLLRRCLPRLRELAESRGAFAA